MKGCCKVLLFLVCIMGRERQDIMAVALDGDDSDGVIHLAGIYDTTVHDWASDIFKVTVDLINREWRNNNRRLELQYALENSKCDETTAVRSYWNLRTENGNRPLDGIIGDRCSEASISLARILGLEEVPQLSPASNSPRLSDHEEFPFFSRMVAPGDERGEVGATVAMLREFGWSRLTTLNTDMESAKEWVTSFRKAWMGDHDGWSGQISYSGTIPLATNGTIDVDAIELALNQIPTDRSRVVVLAADQPHAFVILKHAAALSNFPRDTIWIGGSSWIGTGPLNVDWIQDSVPGYLGVLPLQNRNSSHYTDFVDNLQTWQRSQGRRVTTELPPFAAEMVDAIRAMATAIASPNNNRTDGAAVVRELRLLDFEGVSGRVSFNDLGDRQNPLYSIFNAQAVSSDGRLKWEEIGTVGTQLGSINFTSANEVCWAQVGCVPLADAPSDSYPEPLRSVPIWLAAVIGVVVAILAVLLMGLAARCYKLRKRRDWYVDGSVLTGLHQSVLGMRAAVCTYIPMVRNVGDDVEQALGVSGNIVVDRAQWMWQESRGMMHKHDASVIYDLANRWVLYNPESTAKLETAFVTGKDTATPLPQYEVAFASMEQTRIDSGFKRCVKRVLRDDSTEVDLAELEVGGTFPPDLEGQPRVVLIKGDVLQVTKQRTNDNWVFGTKLHCINETAARQLVVLACNGMDPDSANVFHDSGWFEWDKTRVPTDADLKFLKDNIAEDTLACPEIWAKVKDPTVVEKHVLPPSSNKSAEVERAFLSTLNPARTRVVKVERIQNLAMWQTYVVKRQTICNREIIKQGGDIADEALQKEALERYEKRWLFHGTNVEVMHNILQQGFNRSFCGKNATMWGKGVYFARDASYSSCSTYAVPDRNGFQYVMACRVTVGEYCLGKRDAPAPDVRDSDTRTLYDSTVDNMDDPAVFVTYHDAQAYPEYLITFKFISNIDHSI